MAHILDEEGQTTPTASTESKVILTYQFPDLGAWLNNLQLTHIHPALKDEDFETIQKLVALDDDDLNELCGLIKTNLKKANRKFSLSNKATFKSEVTREREKYHKHLSTVKTIQKASESNTSFGSMIVTKEEREALQQLNAKIEIYETLFNSATKADNDANLMREMAIKSISELCKQAEAVLVSVGQFAFAKYLKYNNHAIKYTKNTKVKLENMRKICHDAASIHNKKKVEIEDCVNKVIKETDGDAKEFNQQFGKFIEGEMGLGVLQEFAKNVQVVKMIQHFMSLLFLPNVQMFGSTVNDIDADEKEKGYILILPHAVEYIEDIKNELKQHDVEIIKDCGAVSNKDTAKLLADMIDMTGDTGFEIGFDSDTAEKWFGDKNIEKEEKKEEEKKDFEVEECQDPIDSLKEAFCYHLAEYYKKTKSKAIAISIQMREKDYFKNKFDIYCPAIFGEYASLYHPETINGKLMNMYKQKYGEKHLQNSVSLGFIQCIDEDLGKDIIGKTEDDKKCGDKTDNDKKGDDKTDEKGGD